MKKTIAVVLCFLVLVACKKNQLGGKSTVKGTVAHHSKIIADAKVYIKLDATEFPGEDVGQYDDEVTADINGVYSFKCYKGDYYLYAVGFDYSIPAPHTVVGGLHVKVKNKQTVEANVAVTED